MRAGERVPPPETVQEPRAVNDTIDRGDLTLIDSGGCGS